MGKVDYRRLSAKERAGLRKELRETFGRMGLRTQGQELLLDLLTESERTMVARRLLIAKRLMYGASFDEIAKELRVGMQTIRAVDVWVERKLASYRSVIPPILQGGKKSSRSSKKDIGAPFTLKRLRKTYPAHFLLINLLLDA